MPSMSPRAIGERPIIRDFTLRIQRGDRIGVVGANGTGKTTLLKLLTGELAARRGHGHAGQDADGVDDRPAAQADGAATSACATCSPRRRLDRRARRARSTSRAISRNSCSIPALVDAPIGVAVGRRALAAAAGARVRAAVQPAGARRADQRPRPRDARPAAGSDRRLRRHGADRQPRPRLPRPDGDGHARARRLGQGRHRRRRLRGLGAKRYEAARAPAKAGAQTRTAPKAEKTGPAASQASKKLTYKDQRDYDRLPARSSGWRPRSRGRAALSDPDLYTRDPGRFAELTERIARHRAEIEAAECAGSRSRRWRRD